MPQEELTGRRPNNYSLWHRTKSRGHFEGTPGPPPWCLMNDGDWFEQRIRYDGGPLEVVAYVETIQTENLDQRQNYPVFPTKEKLGISISARMKIPFYVVYHNAACTDFCVKSYAHNKFSRYNQDQYIQFLKQL